MTIEDAKNESSYRSWIKIRWDAGGNNKYRRGYKGLLDVKCVEAANGVMYYVDHLPTLGNYDRLSVMSHDSHQNNIRLRDIKR